MTIPFAKLNPRIKWMAILLSLNLTHVGNAQISWTNTAGGNWNSASNWSPNELPAASDAVFIDANGNYTVTLNVNARVESLIFAAASGAQVFAIPQDTLIVKTNSSFAANCQLSLGTGTISVTGGTLTLLGNGTSSDGTLDVSVGAFVNLTGGNTVDWGGQLNASGQGEILLDSGAISPNPTLALSFSNALFQWSGGFFVGGTVTNEGVVTIGGVNPAYLNEGAEFINQGLVQVSSASGLDFYQSGAGDIFDNLGKFEFTTDSSIYSDGCCGGRGDQAFNNQGLIWKSGGTNTTTISVPFNNVDGTIRVDSGTLSLNDGGISTNGVFTVALDATLDLTGGSGPSWTGKMSGGGRGQVVLSRGNIYPDPVLTLAFTNGLFQWGGGTFNNGTITNAGMVIIGGSNPAYLNEGAEFINQGLVEVTGVSGLDFYEGGAGDIFDNLGTFEFAIDSQVYSDGCCGGRGNQAFNNQGLVWKSAGTNTTTISVPFNNLGGTIQVDDGLLSLSDGGSSSNATFALAAEAALDLTGGSNPQWSGQLTGSGAGQVLLSSGNIFPNPALTLAFTNNLFVWGGGTFYNGTVTNAGIVVIAGGGPAYLNEGATFINQSLVQVSGINGLDFSQSGPGDIFNNLPGSIFEFTTDSTVYSDGCCGGRGNQAFNNQGLVWKSGGTNTTTISVPFNNLGGAIQVDNGRLTLSEGGVSSNGNFIVAAGAALDLTGGNGAHWSGQMTGTGAGQVELSRGSIYPSPTLSLAFTNGLFQWGGGTFIGGTITNAGMVIIDGGNAAYLNEGAVFFNQGLLQVTGAGGLDFSQSGVADIFNNLPGSIFEFTTDSSVYSDGCCGGRGNQAFNNQGLIWKANGTNTTTISVPVNNLGGTIQVDEGTLSLSEGGSSSNGNFIVAGGATLDLTGGGNPRWSGVMTGGGKGQAVLRSGTIDPNPALTLAFTNNLFLWSGGTFYAGAVTNAGIVIIGGGSPSYLNEGAVFVNQGLVQISSASGLDFYESGNGNVFDNLPGGTLEFTTDSQIYTDGCCGGAGGQAFNNQGLLWKSSGTNTSTISINFNNQGGAVQVDQGTLSLGGNNYAQGRGELTIGIAPQGASGLLALSGAASLSGPLNLVLAQGYVPPAGTQFQILSAGSVTGSFSTLSLPPGFVVNYSNTGVYATYTGSATYVISATNNPPSAGVVENTGVFIAGSTNLLTALPDYGYAFANWTKNGVIVGTNEILTNVVTASASFTANYVATNLTHVVTVATSPANVVPVLGAGTYGNNASVTISAPAVATNGQYLYTFQYFARNDLFTNYSNVIHTTFSTIDRPDIRFVAYYDAKPLDPLIVNVTANYGSPVPKTTNFILQLQFDRSMNSAISPIITLSNAGPNTVQPTVGIGGQWSTRVFASDTYTAPPITFGPGMDGTVQVLASGAADTNGNKLILTNILTLQVLSTPPVVVLSSPTNGALFTTTNSINFSASANSMYGIATLTIYTGTNAIGTTSATNLTMTLSNLSAGSYPLFAVAADANGTSATSLVAHITLTAPGTSLIDFEAVDATTGPVTNAPLAEYLARYGVTFHRSTNTMLAIEDDTDILDGTATVASSGVNLLTQIGTNGAISYTLNFSQPYQSIHWTRTELLAGTAGVISPEWRAFAYNSNGLSVGSVGEKQKASYTNIPAASFTLAGSNIMSVTFFANNSVGSFNTLPLDDLLLSTFPPGANISITLNAGGGTNYSAPGQITLTAAASETGGVISQIDFYEGQNLLGTVTGATNASIGLMNLAAGTYSFTAVASDGTFSRTSAPLNVNVAAAAGITVINFDALDASAGAVGGKALSNYLAGFGVSFGPSTLGTRLEVLDENNLSGSAAGIPSSPPNLFTQAGLNTPVKFVFIFNTPLGGFGFTRAGLAAGPAGVSHPAWTAYALNASGKVIETVSEPLIFSLENVPPRSFQLTGGDIARVRFESDSQGIASFSAILLDDLVLDTNTGPVPLAITLGAQGPFTAGVPIELTASVTDSLSPSHSVAFYDGGNLIGTASNDVIEWTNALAGSHSLTAQLTDSTGYSLTSAAVSVTVKTNTSGLTPVLVDFDSPNATAAPVTGTALTSYLEASGIKVTNISTGTKLAVENQSLLNGGGYVIASSPSNVLTQIGSNKMVSFTLSFSRPLAQFSFTRPELVANPFVSEPAWELRAYDQLGVLLAGRSEGLISSYTNVPARAFTLPGAAIATVEFISHGNGLTTFSSVVMDDFILAASTNPPPSVVITNPIPGQIFTSPEPVTMGVDVAAATGTITNVSLYANSNFLASIAAPFVYVWNDPPQGAYSLTAVATDSSGLSRTSAPVNITVNPSPTEFGILTQPIGQTVAVGGSAVFSVQTTGTNAVTYQWFQNGAQLQGQTESTLTIFPVSVASAGAYTVVASSVGQPLTSLPALLVVLEPPAIAIPPQSQQGQIGSNVTLSVAAAGSPPLNFQWLLNGTGIDGATNATLIIPVAQPINSGDYQVIVGNQVGFAESSIAVVSISVAGGLSEEADFFSNRISIDPLVGPVFGNNINATLEAGEPLPDGKPAGKSIWYTWHASFDGVISLTTQGSSFDTLLAVYTGTNISELTPVAADDDSGGYFHQPGHFQLCRWHRLPNRRGWISGSFGPGRAGLAGRNRLSRFELQFRRCDSSRSPANPPTKSFHAGANVKLSVTATSPAPLTYQWFYQNAPIAGASSFDLDADRFFIGRSGPLLRAGREFRGFHGQLRRQLADCRAKFREKHLGG
jgi:hypothetical protein